MHCGSTSLVGTSDAAYGGLSAERKCRLEYVIGLMLPTLSGRRRILQRPSKISRKLVKSQLGGDVYALSDLVGHLSLLGEFPPLD